jgi:hypothetical protein
MTGYSVLKEKIKENECGWSERVLLGKREESPCPWQELRLPFYLSMGGCKMVKSKRESYLGERKKEG